MSKFKKLREKSGKTQQWVACELDVCVRTIRNWESGRTKIPEAYMSHFKYIVGR